MVLGHSDLDLPQNPAFQVKTPQFMQFSPHIKHLSITPMLEWATTGLRGMWSRAGRAGALQLRNRSPSSKVESGICS